METRLATVADVDEYVDHLLRFLAENGEGGVFFSPFPQYYPRNRDVLREKVLTKWLTPFSECGWERSIVADDEGRIVGHLDLEGGAIAPEAHRAGISMGLEPAFQGHGLGPILMAKGLDLARELQFVKWVDLGVFDGNGRAIEMYKRFGFKETGRVFDKFRHGEHSITDIQMSLRIRS